MNATTQVKTGSSGGTGSYEIQFKSGNRYIGKGSEARMNKTAARLKNIHNDPVVNRTWTPATNNEMAFIQEYLGMANYSFDFGGVLYNKIHSPGRKLYLSIFISIT